MPKPPSEIYEEWLKLIDRKDWGREDHRQPHPDQIAAFESLYAKATENGQWRVSVDDASLVASLGFSNAIRQRRYADAAEISRHYLRHPEAGRTDFSSDEEFICRLGFALYQNGQIEEGMNVYVRFLTDPARRLVRRRNAARSFLLTILADIGLENAPDPRFLDFVGNLLAGWKKHQEKSVPTREAKSNQELFDILESTYPPRKSI